MKREIIADLLAWKNSKNRKPLILLGARQVGKTYILKDFGAKEYKHVAYVNFDNNKLLNNLFTDYSTERILKTIEGVTGVKITAGETLIIFDEIQEVKGGLGCLKYFCENAPEQHVAVAGSLLGIAMHGGESFPVGKVNFLRMFPMTYTEFVRAKGNEELLEPLENRNWEVINLLHDKYVELLREYYCIGGMPEVVSTYIQTSSLIDARNVQLEILKAYDNDISKHASKQETVRINQVWQSIPSQLSKENRKFLYGALKKGGRAKEFELAIQWLQDAGLVYKVNRVAQLKQPLKFYEDFSAFKLYCLDCGLAGAMSDANMGDIMLGQIHNEWSGAMTELYVATQLYTKTENVFYYSRDDSRLEIDFVVQKDRKICPLEVKSEENLQSKSLKTIVGGSEDMTGIRYSMSKYREQDRLINIPLYAACLA
ncbi:MAG: ATP-binding protein [Bacteroidales bacterium]|nr:ATP-binding protein [Bacteroidales bacterium]